MKHNSVPRRHRNLRARLSTALVVCALIGEGLAVPSASASNAAPATSIPPSTSGATTPLEGLASGSTPDISITMSDFIEVRRNSYAMFHLAVDNNAAVPTDSGTAVSFNLKDLPAGLTLADVSPRATSTAAGWNCIGTRCTYVGGTTAQASNAQVDPISSAYAVVALKVANDFTIGDVDPAIIAVLTNGNVPPGTDKKKLEQSLKNLDSLQVDASMSIGGTLKTTSKTTKLIAASTTTGSFGWAAQVGTPREGQTATWYVFLGNTTNKPVTSVSLTDITNGSGLENASASGTGWTCTATTAITCTYANGLAVGEISPPLTITAKAPTIDPSSGLTPTRIDTNKWTITGALDGTTVKVPAGYLPNPPESPNYFVQLSPSTLAPVVAAGATATMKLSITNLGGDAPQGTLTIAAPTTALTASGRLTCTDQPGKLNCRIPALAKNETLTSDIRMSVPSNAVEGVDITANAAVMNEDKERLNDNSSRITFAVRESGTPIPLLGTASPSATGKWQPGASGAVIARDDKSAKFGFLVTNVGSTAISEGEKLEVRMSHPGSFTIKAALPWKCVTESSDPSQPSDSTIESARTALEATGETNGESVKNDRVVSCSTVTASPILGDQHSEPLVLELSGATQGVSAAGGIVATVVDVSPSKAVGSGPSNVERAIVLRATHTSLVADLIDPASLRFGQSGEATFTVTNRGESTVDPAFVAAGEVGDGITGSEGEGWRCVRLASAVALGVVLCRGETIEPSSTSKPAILTMRANSPDSSEGTWRYKVIPVNSRGGLRTTPTLAGMIPAKDDLTISASAPTMVTDFTFDPQSNSNQPTRVTLSALSSGGSITWVQTDANPRVELSITTIGTASFTAPDVDATRTYAFRATATDGTATSFDDVSVRIEPAPAYQAPAGDASLGSTFVGRIRPDFGRTSTTSATRDGRELRIRLARAPRDVDSNGPDDPSGTTLLDSTLPIRADALGSGTLVVAPAGTAVIVGASISGVSWRWSIESGDETLTLSPSIVAAVAAARGPLLRFSVPDTSGILRLKATVALDGATASDIVTVVVGAGSPARISFGDVSRSKSLTVGGTARTVTASVPAGSSVTWSAASPYTSIPLTLTPSGNSVRITGVGRTLPSVATVSAVARNAAGEVTAIGDFSVIVLPAINLRTLCDVVGAANSAGFLTRIPGVAGLDLTAELADATANCRIGSRMTFRGKSFTFAGASASGVSGSLDRNGLHLTSGTFTFPDGWPLTSATISEESGGIHFPISAGRTLGDPTFRLAGSVSAAATSALAGFAGWTWNASIGFEVGRFSNAWIDGLSPASANGSRSRVRASASLGATTVFEISAENVELVTGLAADISGTISVATSGTSINMQGTIAGSWRPFSGVELRNMSVRFITGQPTRVSGDARFDVAGLRGLSLATSVSITDASNYSISVSAGQTRDLTVTTGFTLRGASVSGTLTRAAQRTSGSVEFEVPRLDINGLASIRQFQVGIALTCIGDDGCDSRFTLAGTLQVNTTGQSLNLAISGTVNSATNLVSITATAGTYAIAPSLTLTNANFTYQNRAGTTSFTARGTARILETTATLAVSYGASTVISGGIDSLRLFGATGPTISAEIAMVVDGPAPTWRPTVAGLAALNLPAVTLPATGFHITGTMQTPASLGRILRGAGLPQRFVVRANVSGSDFTMLDAASGSNISGTSFAGQWNLSINLPGSFGFIEGITFSETTVRITGSAARGVQFGLGGNINFTVGSSTFSLPFVLPSLDSADWTIRLRADEGSIDVEPITGLSLTSLSGTISRTAAGLQVAVTLSQGRDGWPIFAGVELTDASISATAQCANLDDLANCRLTLSARGALTLPGGLRVTIEGRRAADAWSLSVAGQSIDAGPGVRIRNARVTLNVPDNAPITVTATGSFQILGSNLTASISYSNAGLLVEAGFAGSWSPIAGGPTFSDVSIAFATYDNATYDPIGAIQPQRLAANDPTLFGRVSLPAGLVRSLGLEGVSIEPVGLSLGNLASGTFQVNINLSTGERWLINAGNGTGLKVLRTGIRLGANNGVPFVGLFGDGLLMVPSQRQGVPVVLSTSIAATGELTMSATLGINASGQQVPWLNAFGINGMTVNSLAVQVSYQIGSPVPGLGAHLSISLPANLRSMVGMEAGVELSATLNISPTALCISLRAGAPARQAGAPPKVVNLLSGMIVATQLEMTFAPFGCRVGEVVIDAGIRLAFDARILGVDVSVRANIDVPNLSFEGSVDVGAVNLGPLRVDRTRLRFGVYGLRPLSSFFEFEGGFSLGDARVEALINVRSGGFDLAGSIQRVNLIPGLVEVKDASVRAGFDIFDFRLNLNVSGSVEVLLQKLNVNLNVSLSRNGIEELNGAVDAQLGLGDFLSINGRFVFNMTPARPVIGFSGSVRAAGFDLLEVSGSINRNALSVSASVDIFGIFNGSIEGKVVWCNADNSERITNERNAQVKAQSGDFYFGTSIGIRLPIGGFSTTGSVAFGYSNNNNQFPQRQVCRGNGRPATGTAVTTTTTTSTTTTTMPSINSVITNQSSVVPNTIAGGLNGGLNRNTIVPPTTPALTTTTIALRQGVPITAAPVGGFATPTTRPTGALFGTTTTTRPPATTTTLAPSPPVARTFFGKMNAEISLGGAGFGGSGEITGTFSTSGNVTLSGRINVDLTIVQANATVSFARTVNQRGAVSTAFNFSANVSLLGAANTAISGSFSRANGRTTYSLTARANVDLYVLRANVDFTLNNNGVVGAASVNIGSCAYACLTTSVSVAYEKRGNSVRFSFVAAGSLSVWNRKLTLANGRVEVSATMNGAAARGSARISGSVDLGPISLSVAAALDPTGIQFDLVGRVGPVRSGRATVVGCGGRGLVDAEVRVAVGTARVSASFSLFLGAKLWGYWDACPGPEVDDVDDDEPNEDSYERRHFPYKYTIDCSLSISPSSSFVCRINVIPYFDPGIRLTIAGSGIVIN